MTSQEIPIDPSSAYEAQLEVFKAEDETLFVRAIEFHSEIARHCAESAHNLRHGLMLPPIIIPLSKAFAFIQDRRAFDNERTADSFRIQLEQLQAARKREDLAKDIANFLDLNSQEPKLKKGKNG